MVLRHRILIIGVFLFIFAFRNRLVLSEATNGPVTSSHSTIDNSLPGRGDLPDTTADLARHSVSPGINYVSATNEGDFGILDEFEDLTPTGGLALSHGGRGREGFFSSESRAELPHVLPLRGYTSLSFRTCSYGVFLYQRGDNSDSIRLELDQNGLLVLVTSHQQGLSSTHSLSNLKLNDNRWHHVFLKYELGSLFLGADTQRIVIGNETNLDNVANPLALNLSSTNPALIIGGGMPGCYLEGANTQLATDATAYVGIDWDTCPLPMGKNCSGYPTDPCFPEPCGKGGVCVPAGENYSCVCYTRYSGETCQQDDGPLCLREENECQNAGVCQEDRLGNATHCACATGYMGHRCETTVRDHCTQNACQNNGTCVINEYGDSFECDCAPGFMGPLCGTEENFCSFEPCLHGGLCTPIPNGFICNCSHTGYRGDVCEVNIDECQELSVFCQEGSTCFDLYGTFECACPPGFGGADCSIDMDECSSRPCQNGGVCTDGVNAFFCECPRGFAGRQCEVNIDDCFDGACSPNSVCVDQINNFECQCLPGFSGLACETNLDDCEGVYCSNGGTCRDGVQNYTCDCRVGFTGPLCDHNVDECAQNPCLHAYNCTDLIGDYACACESGWMGKNCDEGGSECHLVPCLNNGTCVNRHGMHVCVCLPGYEGIHCELNVDDCAENPCENGGSCEDGIANFTCICPESFMGPRCEEPFDDCASHPCFNGASCVSTPGQRTHYCECLEGFEGLECENNINDCQTRNVVCSDGKICFDLINAYECRCPEGYSGSNCSINIDECQGTPCENGGTCHDGIANYTCTCPTGYTGRNCQEDVDECVILSPCVNGICVNNDGSYECYCRPGFSGDNCSLEFDECLYLPCKNGGTCINMINSYQCQCPPGFTGTDCETDIDECESQPCQNGATCVDGIAEFTCECPPGFADPLCATNIDECESNPCLNDGACTDGINMFECDCAETGFKGLNCEINIDDCVSDPCQHESNCTDLVKDYNCSCYAGYIGKNCEEDVMECASAPCQHGGSCFEFSNTTLYEVGWFDFDFSYATAGGFQCQCQPGFEGQLCEVNIDECASAPCLHGTCEDGINAYECHCEPGFEGEHCETEIDECQRFDPCTHGTCVDKIADYECRCYSEYGGKNCSVLLEGCQDVECLNEGTCVPLLFNENVHEFRCDCEPGFTGRFCQMGTTVSMGGDAHLILESQEMDGYELSFSFRTTLANVVLAVGQGVDYFTLVLHEGRLKLHSSFLNRYNGIYSGSSLNDGEWQMVTLSMNATHSLLAANNDTTQHDIGPASNISFTTTYLGGVTSNLRILVTEPPFTGCFRDVVLNEEEIIPSSLVPASKVNVTEGCLRVPQCSPNPCHNEGLCIDLWTSFKCQCKRPYLGDTCRMSFTPATFGNEDIRDSLATVDIPVPDQYTFRRHVDISMLLRTRQNSGLVFYFGKTLESANQLGPETDSDSYLLAELVDGKVVVKVRLGGEEEFFETDHPFISDGAPHLLHVERSEEKVLVNIDERNILNATLINNGDLMAQILYLGGVPIGNSNRVKRQLGISIINSEGLNKHFKGVLQDIRISNGNETRYVELFPLEIIPNENFSLSGSPLIPTDIHHVLSGSVSDDTCKISPCLQGGTCSVTFNDFYCSCPTGFKGKVCDELEYCAMHQCPPGGQCQNLIDGYECIEDITFNGNTSSLVYQARLYNASPFHSFSTQYRSKVGGIIMSASVQEGSVWVGVAPDVLVVQQVNGSTLTTQFHNDQILDGDWHNITIFFETNGVEVLFDSVPLSNNDQDNRVIVDFDVLVRRGGIQIGSLPDGLNLRSSIRLDVENVLEQNSTSGGLLSFHQHFRGCMSEARVGGLLLPVYSPEELANNTAVNVFDKVSNMGMSHGCQVCFESECQNGGQCLAPNNTFECSCPAGFQGVLCQVNIDECKSNTCQNGATCIDGINEYSCDCPPGYEGQFCENEIDECRSNPCQNGGTCFDEIAAFRCDCPEDFMGKACDELKVKNCSKNQCQNGAPCIDITNPQTGIADNYTCECSKFFTGYNCDISVDFCVIEQVQCNRGTCQLTRKDEGWSCECEEGFEGVYCEFPTDECVPNPCQNDGICTDHHLFYTCLCQKGWKGENCTEDVNECIENPGLCHTGECINVEGAYFCECDLEHCGEHCKLPNPCYEQSINCTNGECMKNCNEETNETQPYCKCFEGWQGEFCDEEVQALTTISIIIGVVVGLMVLIAAVGLTIFFMMAKKKRETSGTYSPSKQEFYSPRVEMGNMMKPPPEERLI